MSDVMKRAEEMRASADPHYNCAQSVFVPFAERVGLDLGHRRDELRIYAVFARRRFNGRQVSAVLRDGKRQRIRSAFGRRWLLFALRPLRTLRRRLYGSSGIAAAIRRFRFDLLLQHLAEARRAAPWPTHPDFILYILDSVDHGVDR